MKENYDFSQGKRGAVIPTSSHQIKVNLTLDKEIIDWFKAKVNQLEGGDYHQLINQVLQEYIKQNEDDKEAFYAYLDRKQQQPKQVIIEVDELDSLTPDQQIELITQCH